MKPVLERPELGQHVRIVLETCHQLACPMAAPWVYRRAGVYYLRLRPSGTSKKSITLSLRTRQRDTAMRHSRRIQATLKVFHLDRPEDTWDELAGPLKELAESTLWELISLEDREAKSLEYSELLEDLQHIAATQPVTSSQVKAIKVGARILQAAQARLLNGDPEPLGDLIEELAAEPLRGKPEPSDEPDESPKGPEVYMSQLSALYLAEVEDQLRPGSMRDMRSSCKTLTEALRDSEGNEIDLRTHTREHMVALKAALMPGRKPLTVNKLLTRLSTLFSWAVNSGYLEKTYNKGLKISKGLDSGRKAFSPEQVKKVMSAMGQLPEDSWKRWAMSLGVITGARIGEVYQLTKADVRKVGDTVVIDLNETGNKSLKNKHSKRLVPLVDGAYGFDLKAFLSYVNACQDKLFDRVNHNFTRVLNETLRDILDLESGEGLTFHSLRHSLASLMRYRGIPVGVAQDILGHSSQTITFDLYGGDMRLAVGKLEAALKESFEV